MADEQAGNGQPEAPVPYDTDLQNDVRSAMAEVAEKAAKAEPAPAPAESPASPPIEKTAAERARDEQGRFARVEKDEPKPPASQTAQPAPQTPPAAPTQPAAAPVAASTVSGPPGGWSVKAKAEWDKLAPHIREAITAREAEVSKGFSDFQGLRGFVERARGQGQDPAQVVQAYVGIEDLLRRDPVAGFRHIANNTGLTQHQQGQLFAMLAQQLGVPQGHFAPGASSPGGSSAPQTADADPTALRQVFDPLLSPVMQRIQQLESSIAQQTEAQKSQRLNSAASVIEHFRQDPKHRYYENLESTIGDLLEGGVVRRTGDFAVDLAAAYDMAARLHPEVSELLLNERVARAAEDKAKAVKDAAEKARSASRSVTGSPVPGAMSAPRKNGKEVSYQEDLDNDVRNAMREVSSRA